MKLKISLLLIMVCIFRFPVFTVKDGSDLLYMKVPIRNTSMVVSQIHSVSHSLIKDQYLITPYSINQESVVYEDQGGAGMPNHKDIRLDAVFISEYLNQSKSIQMMMTNKNTLDIGSNSIKLNNKDYYDIKVEVKRVFLFEYLYKVGKL